MELKTMELKWVLLIAIGTLLVGALLGSVFTIFGNYPKMTLSGDDLKCVDGNGGITECTIINPLKNETFETSKNGQNVTCIFTKVNYPDGNSNYAYVCE